MGDIRSTLDIIMEKAKDVTVTQEDKVAFMRHEVEGKMRGSLQKALDGFINVEDLQSEVESFGDDRHGIAAAALGRDCIKRLVLDGDNRLLLDILSRVAGVDTGPVEKLLATFGNDLETQRADCEAALREHLKRRGVSGPAVIPNLKANPKWISDSAEVRTRFQQELTERYP